MAFLRKRGKYYSIVDKRIKKTFPLKVSNKSEANNLIAQYNAQQQLNQLPLALQLNKKIPLFKDTFQEFFNRPRKRRKFAAITKATKDIYTYAFNSFAQVCGNLPITAYTTSHFNDYLNHFHSCGKNYSINTIANYTRHLYILFNYYVQTGYIKNNIITQTEEERNYNPQVITDEHLSLMFHRLAQKPDPKHLHFVQLAFYFGLRKAEVIAIRAEDYDDANKLLIINNYKGRRKDFIPVLADCEDIVKNIFKNKTGKLFSYVSPDATVSFWDTLNKNCGTKYDFHSLRRTRATQLASKGVEPLFLKEFMRHKDIRTTMKYYIKIKMADTKRNIDQKLVSFLPPFQPVSDGLSRRLETNNNATINKSSTIQLKNAIIEQKQSPGL